MLRILIALAVAMPRDAARADGSCEPVYINRLNIVNAVQYDLVVTPLTVAGRVGDLDPYMGQCNTFTVHGTYSRAIRFPSNVTREAHRAALAYLREAQAAD